MKRSHEIIEILADVVNATAADCTLIMPDEAGEFVPVECPGINYVFGNATYVKENLDELSLVPETNERKQPLIALFCPFVEQRGNPEWHTRAKVRILIACSTDRDWNNEQRLETSFKNILRPIYIRFMQAIREDGRFDISYDGEIPHEYSENYSYGRYGAYTADGEMVSEPIDAINITNLDLKVKPIKCR